MEALNGRISLRRQSLAFPSEFTLDKVLIGHLEHLH